MKNEYEIFADNCLQDQNNQKDQPLVWGHGHIINEESENIYDISI